MENEKSFCQNFWSRTKLILNLVLSLLIVIAVIRVCYVPFIRYHYLFTWHVVLGSLAYLLLMPESLLIFDNSWFTQLSRKQKSWIHRIVILIASILAIICAYLDYHRKEIYKVQYPDLKHFESAHSITGLISVVLLIFANLTGLFTVCTSWFRNKIVNVRPVILKLVHNLFGQFSFIIGVISIIIVLYDPWFSYYTMPATRIILTVIIVLSALWSLINSFVSECGQINTIRN